MPQCTIPGCVYPSYPNRKAKKDHEKVFHGSTYTVPFNGNKVSVQREGICGKLACPCQNSRHARFSYTKLYSLCRKEPHPSEDDVFPDAPVAGQSTSEIVENTSNDTLDLYVPETQASDHEPFDDVPMEDVVNVATVERPSSVPRESTASSEPHISTSLSLAALTSSVPTHTSINPPKSFLSSDQTRYSTNSSIEEAHDRSPLMPDIPDEMQLLVSELPSKDVVFAPIHENQLDVVEKLSSLGVCVDPTYRITICLECRVPIRYEFLHSHLRNQHSKAARRALPSKDQLMSMLEQLQAHQPKSLFPGPIPVVPGLAVVDAIKCTIPLCTVSRVFTNRKRFNEHCVSAHTALPASERKFASVKAHLLSNLKGDHQMVEVIAPPSQKIDPLLDAVTAHSHSLGLYSVSSTFQPSINMRSRGTIFAQTGWEHVIAGVDLSVLRPTVRVPSESNSVYHRLVKCTEDYYMSVAPKLIKLPTLTLRSIASSGELIPQPFRRPQEDATIKKYSKFTAGFLVFLLRHMEEPVQDFDVPLHRAHVHALISLRGVLTSGQPEECMDHIHATIVALLRYSSKEAMQVDYKDLFTLYLLVYHLTDDCGNTTRVTAVPPNIAAAQWCFRATAAEELIKNAALYDGDTFRSYQEHAKVLITDGQPTLFTRLRQKQAFFSTLAYAEPGIPQFIWDTSMKVLSLNGYPISVDRFRSSIDHVREEMQTLFNKLCDGHDFSDMFSYIDMRTDPTDENNWFRDSPRDTSQGISIVSQDPEGLARYSVRLLGHLSNNGRYFTTLGGKLVPFKSAIWEWINDLDEFISAMYYAVTATWGGGARGTECDHIKHTIIGSGARHVFILNGLLAIMTTYVKTQHKQGHGRLIVRTPCHGISRLVLAAITVLFPVAAVLATHIMDVTRAQTYLSCLFVRSGVVLDSGHFSTILEHYTEKYLGIGLGLRDYRQVMCSMLCSLSRTDFGAPDEDDHDLIAIHSQFGHSRIVGDAHYGLQGTNALETISHTAVSSMQRVSLRWHASIGHIHPRLHTPSNTKIEEQDQTEALVDRLLKPMSSMMQDCTNRSMVTISSSVFNEFRVFAQGLGSHIVSNVYNILRGPLRQFVPMSQGPSPLVVHPRLNTCLRPLFPGPVEPQFTCCEQAELVQSSFTNDHVLAILPTGSGKSLAFFSAAILHPKSLFIVITPLVALTEDLARRLAATPINGGEWQYIKDPFSAQIVLVSAHQAGTQQFYDWAEANSFRLQRTFIDEAHHIFVSDNYRSCFKLFHRFTQLKKPITFLSATIALHSVLTLCKDMMIDPSLLRIIRMSTSRPNIAYSVIRTTREHLMATTSELFSKIILAPEERGVIYTTSIAFTLEIAAALDISYYISRILPGDDANKIEKSQRFQRWRLGKEPRDRWIAATICFAEGVDYPSVRHAIIVEPRDMLSFLQESGRLGRDGKPSRAIAIWTRPPSMADASVEDHRGIYAMSQFLQAVSCRRLQFKEFDPQVHSCASSVKNELCDRCETLVSSQSVDIIQENRFDLPPVAKKPDQSTSTPATVDVAHVHPTISVASNGEKVDQAYASARGELELFHSVLQRAHARGCPDCWVLKDSPSHNHTHKRSSAFLSVLSSLRTIQRHENTHWPYCYLCWVPFRYPCNHPLIEKNVRAQLDNCPYHTIPYFIPTLLTLIFLCNDDSKPERAHLKTISSKISCPPFTSLGTFKTWLSVHPDSPDTIPRFAIFLNAFYECFIKME